MCVRVCVCVCVCVCARARVRVCVYLVLFSNDHSSYTRVAVPPLPRDSVSAALQFLPYSSVIIPSASHELIFCPLLITALFRCQVRHKQCFPCCRSPDGERVLVF